MTQRGVALLGKKDTPTDAVEEYSAFLSGALALHGLELQIVRVDWEERGWKGAVGDLKKKATEWDGQWVLVQYTALAWSRRGFPLRFRAILKALRRSGARIAVTFHDVEPFAGKRLVDKLRRNVQRATMRKALRIADLAVFTVPVEKVSWIGEKPRNAVFIPVGANLPQPERYWSTSGGSGSGVPRVAVFGVTGGLAGVREAATIRRAVAYCSKRCGRIELDVFGRHAEAAEGTLRALSAELPVEISVQGVISAEEVAQRLGQADALLFVRGAISSRRGSAIAGIACGLAVIAFAGSETAAPITEAGVVLFDPTNENAAGERLLKVLSDAEHRKSLVERSKRAQEEHFSWRAIAQRYAEALEKSGAARD